MEFMCYEGLEKSFTFKVDATTSNAVSADPKQVVGKVVAMTGNFTVGYGTAGDPIIGVVETVELTSTNDRTLIVAVRRFRSYEGISCAGSETAGDYAAVDGKGGVQASSSATNATIFGVDSANKTCTLLVM